MELQNNKAGNHPQASLKKKVKRNITKAWYKLDKKSYSDWLQGRAERSSELSL
tara:strand:- start:1100 stop:1258 length:159 start_codon:yes stop_codon:yes gene_type:complete